MRFDEDEAIRSLVEGTANDTGEQFFQALVKNLARVLKTDGAWVTEYLPESRTLRSLAFWMKGSFIESYEYIIDGTPCQQVVEQACPVHVPENVVNLFPADRDLATFEAVSYMGVPLMDIDGQILGNLAVMHSHPLPIDSRCDSLFRIFAARAAAEHQRLRSELRVRERELKISRLLESAMDAIVELDENLTIRMANPAAEKVFGRSPATLHGKNFEDLLTSAGRGKFAYLAGTLKRRPEGQQYLWIPDGLEILHPDGKFVPAEATLSRFEMQRTGWYTVILRNVNDLLAAREKIRTLMTETEYLKEQLQENFDTIIGESEALTRTLRDVTEVAPTDATVLILGETGCGKELIARCIHEKSRRRDKPMIKVNCAAIPSALIESEFFGHEKGAFTGAVAKREGRFALADGGTIFLDEVGELPLDVQAKLLRVLQEGEFEPLGSSKTQKVDVRVVAATNQNLKDRVRDKTFREDLFYRLHVFPIHLPPLREREDDVILLANYFAQKIAARMGRPIEPPSQSMIRRFKTYDWPGNIRELQNVIERAVITSRDGQLNLDRALPRSEPSSVSQKQKTDEVLTFDQLQDLERTNIIRALNAANWKVAGENGAAQLLGMNASTLASKMKTLSISRPK